MFTKRQCIKVQKGVGGTIRKDVVTRKLKANSTRESVNTFKAQKRGEVTRTPKKAEDGEPSNELKIQ